MNVIILAGGYAQRLWPLTKEFPKPLLRIAGKPVICHLLENLSRFSERENIIIAIDKTKEKFFRECDKELMSYTEPRPRLSIHESHTNGRIKGVLEKLQEVRESQHLLGLTDREFLIVGGDNVFGIELEEFGRYYRRKGQSCNAIQDLIQPLDASEYGVPTLGPDDRIIGLTEKPVTKHHKQISTACYILQHKDIADIDEYFTTGGMDNLGAFVEWLLGRTELAGFRFDGAWYDVGNLDGLLGANSMLLSRSWEYQCQPSLPVICDIHEPIYVEPTVRVKDCKLGPNIYWG